MLNTNNNFLTTKNLNNYFSNAWLKLLEGIRLSPVENISEPDSHDFEPPEYLYPQFTDRVDPSLYYSILFPQERHVSEDFHN
ncbi:MAG: hypothetical protein QNJ47_16865 [Nostocaceae cyanobacterium]|nr:hypothetical protein [Nostocaceae cyanobacterium]